MNTPETTSTRDTPAKTPDVAERETPNVINKNGEKSGGTPFLRQFKFELVLGNYQTLIFLTGIHKLICSFFLFYTEAEEKLLYFM